MSWIINNKEVVYFRNEVVAIGATIKTWWVYKTRLMSCDMCV